MAFAKNPTSFRIASAASVLSALISGVCLFAGIKIALDAIGAAAVGAWALVQAIMIVSRIMDGGGTTNVVRRVSIAGGDNAKRAAAVVVGLMTSVVPATILSLALLVPAYIAIAYRPDLPLSEAEIWLLAWLSVANAVISATALVALSALEGSGQQVKRYVAASVSSLAFLGCCLALVPTHGVIGYAAAYLAMGATQLAAGGLLVATGGLLTRIPHRAEIAEELRASWEMSLSLGGIALLRLSFEPLTKLLISAVAPLAVVAYFDVALRLTTQVRVLFQAMAQPLLQAGAREHRTPSARQERLFRSVDAEIGSLALVACAGQLAAVPLVSQLFFGDAFNWTFVAMFTLLVVSNTVNALGMTGYYYLLSGDGPQALVVIHIVMLLANAVVGAVGVWLALPLVVVAGYALTFVAGGIFGLTAFRRATKSTPRLVPTRPPSWLGGLLCLLPITIGAIALRAHLDFIVLSSVLCGLIGSYGLVALRGAWSRLSEGK